MNSGRLRKAPENFIDRDGIARVFAEGKHGRRDFLRSAFAAAAALGVGCRRERAQIGSARRNRYGSARRFFCRIV